MQLLRLLCLCLDSNPDPREEVQFADYDTNKQQGIKTAFFWKYPDGTPLERIVAKSCPLHSEPVVKIGQALNKKYPKLQLPTFTWQVHFQLLRRLIDSDIVFNLCFYGLVCRDYSRAGHPVPDSYPLVGWFDSRGIDNDWKVMGIKAGDAVGLAPIGALAPAQEHVHTTEGFGDTLFYGTNTGLFNLVEGAPLAAGWAVCVDEKQKIVDFCYVIIPITQEAVTVLCGEDNNVFRLGEGGKQWWQAILSRVKAEGALVQDAVKDISPTVMALLGVGWK